MERRERHPRLIGHRHDGNAAGLAMVPNAAPRYGFANHQWFSPNRTGQLFGAFSCQ
jgi:hypothetical protein